MTPEQTPDTLPDIVARLEAARPYLCTAGGSENLIVDWFAAALIDFADRRDLRAFAPFMHDFAGATLIDGMQQFLDIQTRRLASQSNPPLSPIEMRRLLARAVQTCFEKLGTDARALWTENVQGSRTVIDSLFFEYVGIYLMLEPEAALTWMREAIECGRPLRDMVAPSGSPVPIRMFRLVPDTSKGIGSAAASAFRGTVLDWIIANPGAPGAGTTGLRLLPEVWASMKDARAGAKRQVELLRRLTQGEAASNYLCLLGRMEEDMDLSHADEELGSAEANQRYDAYATALKDAGAPGLETRLEREASKDEAWWNACRDFRIIDAMFGLWKPVETPNGDKPGSTLGSGMLEELAA